MIRLRVGFGILLVAALVDSELYRWQKRWKRLSASIRYVRPPRVRNEPPGRTPSG